MTKKRDHQCAYCDHVIKGIRALDQTMPCPNCGVKLKMTRVLTKGMEKHEKTCMEWTCTGCLPYVLFWTLGALWHVNDPLTIFQEDESVSFIWYVPLFGPIALLPFILWIARMLDKPEPERVELVKEFLDSVQTPEFTLQGLEKLAKRKYKNIDFIDTHVNYLFTSELRGKVIEVRSSNGKLKNKGGRLLWRKL